MEWLIDHWVEISVIVGILFTVAGLLIRAARVAASWTETKEDDEFVEDVAEKVKEIETKWNRFTALFPMRKKEQK